MSQQLRVWWIPQVGAGLTPFYQEVKTVQQGHELLKSFAQYDLYQFENNIKPDYSNTGGLQVLDADGDWVDWCDSEGSDLNDLENEHDSYDLTAYFGRYGVNGLQYENKIEDHVLVTQEKSVSIKIIPSKLRETITIDQVDFDEEIHSILVRKDGALGLIKQLEKFVYEP